MFRKIDRDELYVLHPLQPRILLSAACSIAASDADQADSTPAIDARADDSSVVEDNSGDVKPDGIFYIRDGLKPLEDGSVDDTSRDVSADAGSSDDGSGDVQPDGIFYIRNDVLDESGKVTTGIIVYMGAPTGEPNVLFPLNPDATDANASADDAVVEDLGGPNVFFPLNDDVAVEASAEVSADGPNVFFPLNTDMIATEVSVPVVVNTPAPESDGQTGAPVASPAHQEAAPAPEVNPLLSHKDDLLGGEKELLG